VDDSIIPGFPSASWFGLTLIAWSFFIAVVWIDVAWTADLIRCHGGVFFGRWIC
jgi:hypothetical protein